MSLLMIHEAYLPVYTCDPDFHCVWAGGQVHPPEVVQEALADLKRARSFVSLMKKGMKERTETVSYLPLMHFSWGPSPNRRDNLMPALVCVSKVLATEKRRKGQNHLA